MLCGNAYERKKDPEKVRAALIDAAAAMIADRGLGGLTVGAVAKQAGVTKGGLFHHFATKRDLIDGVLGWMTRQAEATIDAAMAEDAEPHGRFTRAYLAGVFAERPLPDASVARTLCFAMIADPELQQSWATWVSGQVRRHAETDDNPRCAIARLAADGIWLSSLSNPAARPPITDDVRTALFDLTRPSAAPATPPSPGSHTPETLS